MPLRFSLGDRARLCQKVFLTLKTQNNTVVFYGALKTTKDGWAGFRQSNSCEGIEADGKAKVGR